MPDERHDLERGDDGYEPRSKTLQASVTPSEKKRAEQLVRERRLKSVSEWLGALVRRELDASADERTAA